MEGTVANAKNNIKHELIYNKCGRDAYLISWPSLSLQNVAIPKKQQGRNSDLDLRNWASVILLSREPSFLTETGLSSPPYNVTDNGIIVIALLLPALAQLVFIFLTLHVHRQWQWSILTARGWATDSTQEGTPR